MKKYDYDIMFENFLYKKEATKIYMLNIINMNKLGLLLLHLYCRVGNEWWDIISFLLILDFNSDRKKFLRKKCLQS